MNKISVVGTVGLPACYGGFESLVENITKNSNSNIQYHIFCSSKSYKDKIDVYNNAKLYYVNLNANGIQSIFYDIISLFKTIFLKPEVTLILGVSGCIFLPFFKLFSKSKIITNIDGLEWKRDKWHWLARKFLKLSERIAVKYSDEVVADNQAISDYVLNEYGVVAKTIAYGGDHVLAVIEHSTHIDNDYYLGLCRIEPENNVAIILESFSHLPDKKLKFIGNWERSEFGRKLKAKYSKFKNIEMLDPIYDIYRLYQLRLNCIGYIHGHSAGGTNPSLVEAMHFEKCIFSFDCDFNRYSTENKAVYFSDEKTLVDLINQTGSVTLENIATDMKEIANRRYLWSVITSQYESLYGIDTEPVIETKEQTHHAA